MRCWGKGQLGQLGYGNQDVSVAEVGEAGRDVKVGGRVVQVAAGDSITCVLLESRAVRCWGMGPLGYTDMVAVGSRHTPAEAGDIELGARAQQITVAARAHLRPAQSSVRGGSGLFRTGRAGSVEIDSSIVRLDEAATHKFTSPKKRAAQRGDPSGAQVIVLGAWPGD